MRPATSRSAATSPSTRSSEEGAAPCGAPPLCVALLENTREVLLVDDPPVGLRQRRKRRAPDRDGDSPGTRVHDERETSRGRRAVAHVERARAIESHRPVGVRCPAGDPAGDGDPLAETDEARSGVLGLEGSVRGAGAGDLSAETGRTASKLDSLEARAGGGSARARAGHEAVADDG